MNSFRVDRRILQSVLFFGLVYTFGNIRAQDHAKLQRVIKTVTGIMEADQVSAAELYNELI